MKNERIKEITRKAIEQLIAALNEGRNGTSKRPRYRSRGRLVCRVNAIGLLKSALLLRTTSSFTKATVKLLTESLDRMQTANRILTAIALKAPSALHT